MLIKGLVGTGSGVGPTVHMGARNHFRSASREDFFSIFFIFYMFLGIGLNLLIGKKKKTPFQQKPG